MNSCAAMRGRREDFDEWAALGNPEWAWNYVEPYFRDIETDQDFPVRPHGTRGPLPISRYKDDELIPIQRAFRDACRCIGMAELPDFNIQEGCGVGPWPMNRIGTTRVSAATAFLSEARARPSLTIRPDALVSRVALKDRRALGVELDSGEIVTGRQVILCAGGLASPAILMRSGVGPAGEAARSGIQPQVDLPGVGARLWDHPSVPIRMVPRPGQCVIGQDPRFQMAACFSAPASRETRDTMLVLVTHFDLKPFPDLMNLVGASVVALLNAAVMRPRGYGRLPFRAPTRKFSRRSTFNSARIQRTLRLLWMRRVWLGGSCALMLSQPRFCAYRQ